MSRTSFLSAVLCLGALSAACASSESGKGATTGKTADQAATEIGKANTHLDATLLALKDLVEKPAADLSPQFKTYTKNLGQLETTAKEVAALAAQIDTKSQEYFAQWDKELAAVQDEDIRERSADRKEAISAGFKKIQGEYGEVRDEFKPLLSKLQDIRTVLGADLTMAGLKSVKGTVEDVADDSEDVRESLQELEKRFRDLGVKLGSSGPAAEPAKKS